MDDFNTYKDHATIKNNNGVASIAFDSSGEYLFVGSGKGMVHIYLVSDFKEKKNFSIEAGYTAHCMWCDREILC